MTSQTKKFIEPTDIIGLRLKCAHQNCQAEITLDISKPLEAKRLAVCPFCRQPWLRETDYSLEVAVDQCINGIENLKSAMKNRHWNFALALEIKNDQEAD